MTNLPPSPFLNSAGEEPLLADTAVALQPPAGAAAGPIDLSEIDCIHEIFVGAQKLGQLAGPFDQDAITEADELLYVELKLMDDHRERDLPALPDERAFFDAIEPPPLFLQRCA